MLPDPFQSLSGTPCASVVITEPHKIKIPSTKPHKLPIPHVAIVTTIWIRPIDVYPK